MEVAGLPLRSLFPPAPMHALDVRIASTYFGHYKPWKQSKDMNNFIMIMKNVGISGHCLLTIGFEVPEIGKDGTPLGLHRALGSVGNFIGKIYALFRPYSFIFKYTGLIFFALPFLLSFLHHVKDTKQFVLSSVDAGVS